MGAISSQARKENNDFLSFISQVIHLLRFAQASIGY
jgi:hypothetical protein